MRQISIKYMKNESKLKLCEKLKVEILLLHGNFSVFLTYLNFESLYSV